MKKFKMTVVLKGGVPKNVIVNSKDQYDAYFDYANLHPEVVGLHYITEIFEVGDRVVIRKDLTPQDLSHPNPTTNFDEVVCGEIIGTVQTISAVFPTTGDYFFEGYDNLCFPFDVVAYCEKV